MARCAKKGMCIFKRIMACTCNSATKRNLNQHTRPYCAATMPRIRRHHLCWPVPTPVWPFSGCRSQTCSQTPEWHQQDPQGCTKAPDLAHTHSQLPAAALPSDCTPCQPRPAVHPSFLTMWLSCSCCYCRIPRQLARSPPALLLVLPAASYREPAG